MQFVNVVVHSVEDMNFRVHLQYEFSKLGLDKYLERLRLTESEELQVSRLTETVLVYVRKYVRYSGALADKIVNLVRFASAHALHRCKYRRIWITYSMWPR